MEKFQPLESSPRKNRFKMPASGSLLSCGLLGGAFYFDNQKVCLVAQNFQHALEHALRLWGENYSHRMTSEDAAAESIKVKWSPQLPSLVRAEK